MINNLIINDEILDGVADGSITPADLHSRVMQSYNAMHNATQVPLPQQPQPQYVPPYATSPEFRICQLVYDPDKQWEYQICFSLENCEASRIPDAVKLLTMINATRSNNPTVQNLVEQLLLTCNLTQGEQQ